MIKEEITLKRTITGYNQRTCDNPRSMRKLSSANSCLINFPIPLRIEKKNNTSTNTSSQSISKLEKNEKRFASIKDNAESPKDFVLFISLLKILAVSTDVNIYASI